MTRLIDADKFKDSMKYVCDAGGWLEPVTKAVTEYVKKQIDAQPTVEAEPVRHGKWIDGKAKNIKTGEVRLVRKCSECESGYFIYDFLNSVDEIPSYCPNCGAKMEAEQDE